MPSTHAAVRGPLLTIVAMSLLLLSRVESIGLFTLAPVALTVVAVAQVWRVTSREAAE